MKTSHDLQENSFASACYDLNTITELHRALENGPDVHDCVAWNITTDEWICAVNDALEAKLSD